jgi:urea transport system substrate-binding protein
LKPEQHDCRADFRIGLFVPMSGSAGLWGPSAMTCAELAADEINSLGGLNGRFLQLSVFNASDEADDLAAQTDAALSYGELDAIVGMHTSSVREAVKRTAAGRVPFVYTPLYEGEETSPGVFAIGERPEQQLRPAIHAMSARYKTRRWMMIGNDYIWPRVSHRLALQYVKETHGTVLQDIYVPFGVADFEPILASIKRLKPDCILLSLVGQDAIDFNRLFGELGLSKNILRLSCAFEENGLLAIGAENSEGLHVAAGYFASLTTESNARFKERYHARFGRRAPTLNSLGQSTYEGVHFAAALMGLEAFKTHSFTDALTMTLKKPLTWNGARGGRYLNNAFSIQPVYLARADGHLFEVVQTL